MVQDCNSKRAQYIDKMVDIQNTSSFADPTQVLTSVKKYANIHYGAMMYNMSDESISGKDFRCWGTAVKLAWNYPCASHRYFVNNLLLDGQD